uniref:Aquaporin-4 n=1 Tax=Milnesium tardigradum TaxID=46460 RepID=AQP4_MILTA|nr:RecName: Full=Aquaporin-4; Short=AQP-4 [Milnesium tardigradum]AEP14558.2 aquaporin 4 [Milnesium tardigradum]
MSKVPPTDPFSHMLNGNLQQRIVKRDIDGEVPTERAVTDLASEKAHAIATHGEVVIQIQHSDTFGMDKEKNDWRSRAARMLYIESRLVREGLSESLAMFFFMSLLLGCAATARFTGNQNDPMLAAFYHGFSIIFAIYVAGGISGGLLNPAITFTIAFLGRLSWLRCLIYMSAQYFGAFIASAVVYLIYYDSLQNFSGANKVDETGANGTAGIWSTFPRPYLSLRGAIFNQIFCTMLLTIGFLSICDFRNSRPDKGMFPFAVGMLIMTVFLAFSYSAGAAMNPARDISPRLWTLIVGYGDEVFSYNNYKWFWIPWLFPYVGALLGGVIYEIFIGIHWPKDYANKHVTNRT